MRKSVGHALRYLHNDVANNWRPHRGAQRFCSSHPWPCCWHRQMLHLSTNGGARPDPARLRPLSTPPA
eukprot:11157721-Lingulodinium_polyedra.AAC.1